jgi:hypothetical protein
MTSLRQNDARHVGQRAVHLGSMPIATIPTPGAGVERSTLCWFDDSHHLSRHSPHHCGGQRHSSRDVQQPQRLTILIAEGAPQPRQGSHAVPVRTATRHTTSTQQRNMITLTRRQGETQATNRAGQFVPAGDVGGCLCNQPPWRRAASVRAKSAAKSFARAAAIVATADRTRCASSESPTPETASA